MINSTEEYKAAIVADSRRILPKVSVEIIDPDIEYTGISGSGQAGWSKQEQLIDKVFEADTFYATLERGRWILNGSMRLIPDIEENISGDVGYTGIEISGDDGTFATAQWTEVMLDNISILQSCSLFFPENSHDGVAEDFAVDIYSGETVYYTQSFAGNEKASVSLDQFTVHYPTAIRVTVTRWSLPGRRARIAEILPGIYEMWDGDVIASISVKHQGDFSCVTLPYGVCELKIDNHNRRFEPRNKNGIFQSLEDRQGLKVYLGTKLQTGQYEYKMLGIFYQHDEGWKTGDNGITLTWELVDIIGLLNSREYIAGATMPTTLNGWVRSIVSQLGDNFSDLYHVDENYASESLMATADDVSGVTCGDLLRYVCMATGTWPRADAETGGIAVEPVWSSGNVINLDNLENYPVMKANSDIAAIIFTLNDSKKTKYIVSGNSTASDKTVSIENPFIKTNEKAIEIARNILIYYGGNIIETVGRGDMSSEIGDVDTIWLDQSNATAARRMQQEFSLSSGVMQKCKSLLLQADGSALFTDRVVITTSGTWTAPAGVTRIRAIIVGAGSGGEDGEDGGWRQDGKNGESGFGGKALAVVININDSQTFSVTIGEGGAAGNDGEPSTFGIYSSEDGERYQYGFSDISSGDVFARTGVSVPLVNSGDGGRGGRGGQRAEFVQEGDHWVQVAPATPGERGVAGASGCVIVSWEKVI